jgi:AcrR family transcriptional regulator
MSDRRRQTGTARGRGREDILEAARSVFSDKGYVRTSTREIAEQAGINEAMVFRHFGSKAGLFREAAIEPFQRYVADYVESYHLHPPGARPVLEEGTDFIRGLYDVLAANRQAMIAMLAVREFDNGIFNGEDPLADSTRAILDVFQGMLGVELEVHDYRDVDVPVYSRIIFGAVLGMAVHGPWLNAGEDFAIDRIIAEIVLTIVDGVQPSRTSPSPAETPAP